MMLEETSDLARSHSGNGEFGQSVLGIESNLFCFVARGSLAANEFAENANLVDVIREGRRVGMFRPIPDGQ